MLIENLDKKVHQIWWDGLLENCKGLQWFDMPQDGMTLQSRLDKYISYQHTYKNFCKTNQWEYNFWSGETLVDFVKQEFKQFYDKFCYLGSIIKWCDCARYMLLYVFGGVYADIDTYLLRDLNELLNSKTISVLAPVGQRLLPDNRPFKITKPYSIILGEEPFYSQSFRRRYGFFVRKLNNGVIFSKKKEKLWLEIMDYGLNNPKKHVFESFGPERISDVIFEKKLQGDKDILILPPHYFQYHTILKNEKDKGFQYIVHEMGNNWDVSTDWKGGTPHATKK